MAANARMVRMTNHAARVAYGTMVGSSVGAQRTFEPAHTPKHLRLTVAQQSLGQFLADDFLEGVSRILKKLIKTKILTKLALTRRCLVGVIIFETRFAK